MDLSSNEIVHVKKDNVQYIQFRKLLEYKDILTHAYSIGINENFRTSITNKEDYNCAINSYNKLCSKLNIDINNLVKTDQQHTKQVKIVEKKINKNKPDFNMKEYTNTDGLITNKKNLVLSTTNADCILLLMFDPKKKVVANVHSGWRGTLQRIAVNAVIKMQSEFVCNVEDIIVCICPSIRKCHFEVRKDVKELFENEFIELDKNSFIEEKMQNEKWNIDTIEINKQILKNIGLKEANIIDSGLCSVCNKDLIHSYRVEGKGYKLNTGIIGLI